METNTNNLENERSGNTYMTVAVAAEQENWVRARARELGEKPSFIIRELIRKAMGETTASEVTANA